MISQIVAEFRAEGGIQNFAQLSKFAQKFTVRFLKLLSTHPIHIVVWENFPGPIKYFAIGTRQSLCSVKTKINSLKPRIIYYFDWGIFI